ncbi:uncharacterized protein K02A2.6-like [Armigeres subalbatus]|uniref:uncharacterized protein K02A2.6-like n=1 Tax=Armigeres subalbatus TaxID=124917 RepID=UPI002ED28EE3
MPVSGDFQVIYQQILRHNQAMAEQNTRLMEMMERFGNQENVSNRPYLIYYTEFIIESLASNIREFVYDPDIGLVFDRWYRKYEDLFLKDVAKLDDAAKVRLLLRSLSVTVHDKYVNFVFPKHPREYSFDEMVKKLTELFSVRISLFSKRYQCFQLTKHDADDFLTYAGTVNRCCEDFELSKITADQFKSLIFTCGHRSSKDADIRTRLLSKLEANAADECTLESLITECQRLQNLKHDTTIEKKKTKSEGPKTPCWQCGGMHYVRDCKYTKHVCRDCKQTGHKEGYCGSYTSKAALKKKKHVNGIFSINQVSCTSRRKFLTVDINGSQVTLQLNTTSDITIVSKKQSKKNLGSPTLTPTTRTARAAAAFPLLGELRYPIKLGGVTKTATFYVTNNSIKLIGLDWIELFKLWDTPLSAICNQVHVADGQVNQIQVYKAAYPEVFKNGLGHCKKMKVRLYLKPDAKPVFKPKRLVPFMSMEKVDAELDRLQSLGIITPVDFSQWAAPIVVQKKPGGKVRICADYSTGLNAALEPNHYPLPVPDDIFTKLNGCRYFSVIDLSDAYLQVEVDDDSKQLLTINTHRGLFRFNRLAPGVKSALGAFQQLMNSHAYGFVLREEKCNILQPEVKYLAHIVDENGLRPDPSKVEAIVKMPPPTDVTTLPSFLGAVNFYAKFVPKMHQLRRPLDALLKKDAKFVWNSECQKSFRRFKEVFQSDLHLTHYDPPLDIMLPTPRSPESPLLRIFGQKKGIPVHTANRLQRWALTLLCYNFDIEYVSTTQFGYADVLSRLINGYVKPEEDFIIASIQLENDIEIPLQEAISSLTMTFKSVRGATLQCPVLQQVIQYQRGWPSKIDDIANPEVRPFFAHRDALSVSNHRGHRTGQPQRAAGRLA